MDSRLRGNDSVVRAKPSPVIPAKARIHPYNISSHSRMPMHDKEYYVYVLASKKQGTLYIGVTSDLVKRIWQHKQGLADSFTKKYDVHKLVYYEIHQDVMAAILREKQIKKWQRCWKIKLIEATNHQWVDLYFGLLG